jgi:hypothetical protein
MEQREEIFNDVKRIIIAGAKSQPRSVLQIFRSFVNRWEIAQIRQERGEHYKINHQLLALILVLQNDWPELFLRIVHYPEHLFYIYALVKNKPLKNHCTVVELDEINNLGVAVNEKTTTYAYDVRYQREIVRLFSAFDGDDYFNEINIDDIVMHVTLVYGQGNGLFPISNHIWDTLLSGDPVRIRNLQRQAIKNTIGLTFDQYDLGHMMMLLGKLEEFRQKQIKSSEQELLLDQIEKLLIAWGLLENAESIYKLEELVLKNITLPLKLRMRCLYAFIHRANRGDQQAIEVILRVLGNSQYDLVLRQKTAHLLRYINLNDNRLDEVVNIFEWFSFWEKIIRDTLQESLVKAYEYELDDQYHASWGHEVMKKIKLVNIQWEDLIKILEKINSTDNYWQINKYAPYLREKISSASGNSQFEMMHKYFSLLKGYKGKERSSDNEKEVISEFVEIIPFAEPSIQKEILREALEIQYNLQQNSQKDEWQDVWYQLSNYLSGFSDTVKKQKKIYMEWPESLRGLRTMNVYSPRVVTFVHHLYDRSPDGWKADFGSILLGISNGEIAEQAVMKKEMQEIAKKACYELGLL